MLKTGLFMFKSVNYHKCIRIILLCDNIFMVFTEHESMNVC